jgi:type II secretory pathway pseudopilin PulG
MVEFLIIGFLAIMALGAIAEGIEQANKKILEDENRELINKALKHYAETQGIK